MGLLADRMSRIDASGIRKVFAMAATMKDPVNLSIGQPDYDVDILVKEEAIAAIQSGFNGYTQTWGTEELRDGIAEYYDARFGAKIENVMVTSGVSGGLFLALLATVNPGDEVIFADPYFVMYPHLVNLLGGVPVPVSTYPDFKLTPVRVEAAITDRTRMIIVNSPANPTGVTLNREEQEALAAVARKHDILVLTDEIYEALQYDEEAATMAGMYEKVILLNGLSKSAGMTGWRLGWAAGPSDIIQAMNTLQQYTFVCAPSIVQKAAVAALKADMEPKVAAYREKRNLVCDGLRERFNLTRPGGAFYVFPEAPGGDGDALVKKAIENNLLIIPGSVFSDAKTHFRISFAATNETIQRGVDILNQIATG